MTQNQSQSGGFLGRAWWQGIGAIIGIVALLFGAFTYIRQQQIRELEFVSLSTTSLSVDPAIAITYEGEPVSNLTAITVSLENTGNQDIVEEDFSVPITLTFPESSEIISTRIVETVPKNDSVKMSKTEHSAILEPLLINEDDRIVFEVMVLDLQESSDIPFVLSGRIRGVKELPIISAAEKQERVELLGFRTNNRNMRTIIIIILVLFSVLELSFVYYRERARFKKQVENSP